MMKESSSQCNLMQYRENTQAIVKLFEMLQLFVSVNSQLKNPSSFMRESTQLMNQMIVFIMTVPIVCNNAPDYPTTLHYHFVKCDEATRLESDFMSSQDSERNSKTYNWPYFKDTSRAEVL